MHTLIKKITNNSVNKNCLIILSFLFLTFLSFILLLNTHCILNQSDLAFHLRRIIELKTSILHGQLLPATSFNEYHGSILMSLYPYINLYPIALLSMIIKSKFIILYVWYMSNLFLLFLISYFSSYAENKSFHISFLFTVIYGMSTICFKNGLTDFGELTSLAVLPLIIFGCINWLRHNNYIELAIGLSLIIFSHVLSALIAIIYIFLWTIINYKYLNKNKIISLSKCAGLTTFLTSLVWIPAIYLKLSTSSKIFTPAFAWSNFFNGMASTSIKDLIKEDLDNVGNNGIFEQPDLLALLGILLSICFYKKLNSTIKKLLWVSLLFLLIGTKIPWMFSPKILIKIFGIFQSPQRFFIIPQILLSYIFASIIIRNICSSSVSKLVQTTLVTIFTLFTLFNIYKVFKTHQVFFALISITLVMMCIIILFNSHNPYMFKNVLFIGLVFVAIFMQIDMQQQEVDSHIQQGHLITRSYYYNHIRGTKDGASICDYIKNRNQFRYLISLNSHPTRDYYPTTALNQDKLINDSKGIANNNLINVHHIGYNTFTFNSRRKLNHLVLPLFRYNNESLNVYLDGHRIKYENNKNNLLTIRHISKGSHKLIIDPVSNTWIFIIKITAFIIGLLWLFTVLKFKIISNLS